MGENVDPKWIEMVRRMWNSPRFRSVVDPIPEIAALLSRVDAEATERAAMVCMERRELFYKAREAHPANGKYWNIAHLSAGEADCCFHAIRSTLPTPAARAGEENQ